MRIPRQVLIGLSAAAAVGGAVAVAATRSDDHGPFPVSTTASERASALERFSVFGQSQGRTDANVAKRYARQMAPGHALDPSKTRLVRSDAKGRTYILAGQDDLCLAREEGAAPGDSGSFSCTDPVTAASGEVLPTAADKTDDGWRLSGIVPDGVTDVVLTRHDGSEVRLDVVRNAISVEVAEAPRKLTWLNADGSAGVQTFSGLDAS